MPRSEHEAQTDAKIQQIQDDVRRLVIACCGDLEAKTPGILARLAAAEWRIKVLFGVVGLLAAGGLGVGGKAVLGLLGGGGP